MRKSLAVALMAAVFAALASPIAASAAPVADQTQNNSVVGDGQSTCIDMGGIFRSSSGSQFTAGRTGKLTKIDIAVTYNFGDRPLTFFVWNAVAGLPSGAALARQEVSVSDLAAVSSGGTLSVNFRAPASITKDSQYAFTYSYLDCAGASLNLSAAWGLIAEGGQSVLQTDYQGNWSINGGGRYGMNFTTYVDDQPATPRPSLAQTGKEPNSGLLAFLAAACVLIGVGSYLRFRRRS